MPQNKTKELTDAKMLCGADGNCRVNLGVSLQVTPFILNIMTCLMDNVKIQINAALQLLKSK